MKAAPDLHKKRAERGGRKREGGESERRAGKGTTTQPSAGGTAQSTDLRRCTPLQDQYAKAHRRSRSKAAHAPARFGPAASPRVARGAAKAGRSPWRLRQRSLEWFMAGMSCHLVHGRAARRGVPRHAPFFGSLITQARPGGSGTKNMSKKRNRNLIFVSCATHPSLFVHQARANWPHYDRFWGTRSPVLRE